MRATARLNLVFIVLASSLTVLVLAACETHRAPVVVEEDLPEIRPNLPPVPNVPPPRHKIQYPDGTWSVYGLRKRVEQNIGEEVRIKAYIVKIFEPQPCPEDRTCPPSPMPHLWMFSKHFPDGPAITFVEWLKIGFPFAVVFIPVMWL